MEYFLLALFVVLGLLLRSEQLRKKQRAARGAIKPIHPDLTVTAEPIESSAQISAYKLAFVDLQDPAIGNPREKMTALSLNQMQVLGAAAEGAVVYYAEPGRAHSGIRGVSYFHQKRTIDALVRADFLQVQQNGGHIISKLGLKALSVLPEKRS